MIDTKEMGRLAQAVIGWGCCNQAWLDQSEDTPAAVVGHINEDGETYPVVTIDCDQYSAAGQSLPLGKFYAAANPAVINELLHRLEAAETACKVSDKSLHDLTEKVIPNLRDQLEAAEKERDALRAKIEVMERQEPDGWIGRGPRDGRIEFSTHRPAPSVMRDFNVKPLYLAPGAKGE